MGIGEIGPNRIRRWQIFGTRRRNQSRRPGGCHWFRHYCIWYNGFTINVKMTTTNTEPSYLKPLFYCVPKLV
ncbi:hypothetical protein BLOT_000108 [Blomia tropicalis]|nr:hypothetical protein BLOT_000108 [Blomia tropicalis]